MADFLFDGNASRKKQISLGGTSARKQKNELVENARKEREKRLRIKREEKSSKLIQQTWRAVRVYNTAKNDLRAQWDAKFAAAVSSSSRSPQDIAELIKPLQAFYSVKVDLNRLVGLTKIWIPEALKGNSNFYSVPMDGEHRAALWRLRHTRMIDLILSSMNNTLPAEAVSVFVIMYASLCKITPPSDITDKPVNLQRLAFAAVSPTRLENPLKLIKRDDVRSQLRQTEVQWRDMMVGFGLVPLNLVRPQDQNRSTLFFTFVRDVLTVQDVWTQLSKSVVGSITQKDNWAGCLEACGSDMMEEYVRANVDDGRFLLGNLLDLAKVTLGGQLEVSILVKYVHAVSILLNTMPLELYNSDGSGDENTPMVSVSFANLQDKLQVLFTPSIMAPLLKTMAQHSMEVGKPSSFIGLCTLYCRSLISLPNARVEILNSLAFATDCVRRLWEWMVESKYLDRLVATGISDATMDDAAPICLFSLAYNHLLMVVDDEEFYEKRYPFSFEELAQLVSFFKKIVLQAASRDPSNREEKCSQVEFHISAVKKNMHTLYEKHCRRQFVDPSLWLDANVNVDAVLQDLAAENRNNSIVEEIPFCLSFHDRVKIFRTVTQQQRRYGGKAIQVRRNYIIEDSYAQLGNGNFDFRDTFSISFVNEYGLEEAGIDGGGLFKEYATAFMKAAFGPSYGLFKSTDDQCLYPNPSSSLVAGDHLEQFSFLGRMLGKIVSQGILVPVPFARFFLSKLLGRFNYVDELPSLDPELAKQLNFLKHYDGDFEDLCLTFSLTSNEYGEAETINLLPNGSEVAVTRENRQRYIHLVANHYLNNNIKQQSRAFLTGFQEVIPREHINMFSPDEMRIVICGSSHNIDINDWKMNTSFMRHHNESFIINFWSVVEELTEEERGKLLKFCTGCSRPPILGFGALNPPFSVIANEDQSRLPTASTCVNLLKIPEYESREVMKEKILYSISSEAGFDLS